MSAFTCASRTSFIIHPQIQNSTQTIELLTQQYDAVLVEIDTWAGKNNFKKLECHKTTVTPACKAFIFGGNSITLQVNQETGFIELLINEWNGRRVDPVAKQSLIENLNSKWKVISK